MTGFEWLMILLAFAIGALLGYLVRGRGAPEPGLMTPRQATIRVYALDGGTCASETDPKKLPVRKRDFVHWKITDKDNCMPAGSTVQIRFTNASPVHRERPDHPSDIVDVVLPGAKAGKHEYKVWLVPATGAPYEMEDPELQIDE